MTSIILYNDLHLGDNIMDCIIFSNIKNYIEINNIHIYYSILNEHIKEISQFIKSSNIHLRDNFVQEGHRTWIGNRDIKSNIYYYMENINENQDMFYNNKLIFDKFIIKFHKELLSNFNIPFEIEKLSYIDNDLINIYNNLPDKYKNIDILINNCFPRSGQYDYDVTIWDNYIIELNKKYKIVTTKKVDGVNCTLDDNYNVKYIASISTNSKIIIAINSGPIIGFLNDYTLNNVKRVYTFDRSNCFSYENFEDKGSIDEITFDELDKYIQI